MSCDTTSCGSSQSTDNDNLCGNGNNRDTISKPNPITKHIIKISKESLFMAMLIAFVIGFGFEGGTLVSRSLAMFVRYLLF